MKRFVYSFLLVFGIPFTSFGQQVLTSPLILIQDVLPADFSTEVVDLQNFLYADPDTRIIPPDVGRFGTETINGIAHFQNKYQRTILTPFNRLATGSAEVMTRFKIATIGIKANPSSLKDPQVRADFTVLLSQTVNKLDEEIAKRNNPNYQPNGQPVVSTEEGVIYFRGRAVPQDVSVGRPGRYEISSTEGFFVSESGEQFHYQLPQTTLQPIENPVTFDDMFNNYDYLQELQGEIIYTSLEPGAVPQTVIAGEGGASLKQDANTQSTTTTQAPSSVNQDFFDSVLGNTSLQSSLDTSGTDLELATLIPLTLSSSQYTYTLEDDEEVRVFGKNFTPGIQGVFYQDDRTYSAQTSFISESEMVVALPQGLGAGRAAIGVSGQPHSAVEVFLSEENCGGSRCSGPRVAQITPEEIIFDAPVEIVGSGFSPEDNTVETPIGIYYNLPSSDNGTKIVFTPQYPFTVSLDNPEGNTIPITVRVINEEGLSNVREVDATLNVRLTQDAQEDRSDSPDGVQAQNEFLTEYLESFDQKIALINHEGLVSEVRSVLSETGYNQAKNNTQNSITLGEFPDEDQDDTKPGFFAFLNRLFAPSETPDETFLETIGFVEKAHALTFPYGGRITASYPCTCSANWVSTVIDPRGLAHILVTQPGYTRLYAHFNVYTPGVGVLGSFTPTTGTCWMYVGVGCSPIPTTGVMDLFPGTGTTPF